MELKMEGIKTVEQMMINMKDSIKFVESRLGFVGEDYPYTEGSNTLHALKAVKGFIDSDTSKPFFDQTYDYATIFEGELQALKFAAEGAEREYHKGNLKHNEDLKKAQKIVEGLWERISVVTETK